MYALNTYNKKCNKRNNIAQVTAFNYPNKMHIHQMGIGITGMDEETKTKYQNFAFVEKMKFNNLYELAKFYNVHFFKLSLIFFLKKYTQKSYFVSTIDTTVRNLSNSFHSKKQLLLWKSPNFRHLPYALSFKGLNREVFVDEHIHFWSKAWICHQRKYDVTLLLKYKFL